VSHLVDVTTRRPLTPSRQRAWLGWLAVGVGVSIVAGVAVLHSPLLAVNEIEIAGAEQVEAAEILEEAGIGTGAIMIWLDTSEVEAAFVGHPWVRGVRVERFWPDRLVIDIDERHPAVWMDGPDGWMLVATDGTVLETAETAGEGLLRVSVGSRSAAAGTRPPDVVWEEVVALGRVLAAPLAAVSTLGWEAGELWLTTPEHRVRLGHPIDLADKGRVLQVMMADGLPEGSVLNLVAPRRPAVVPPAGSEVLQAQLEGYQPVDP
jgi:hypothetical protein